MISSVDICDMIGCHFKFREILYKLRMAPAVGDSMISSDIIYDLIDKLATQVWENPNE